MANFFGFYKVLCSKYVVLDGADPISLQDIHLPSESLDSGGLSKLLYTTPSVFSFPSENVLSYS